MILRDNLSLVFGLCLSLAVSLSTVSAERWSRQVSNSEWIPLANPRAQLRQESQISQTSTLPELNLPPQLREEYQSQLLQLQKTQESIQKLLLLQQQLRSQQQLLQNQAYLPNAVAPEEDKQSFHQSSISNIRNIPELAPEILTPPQPPTESVPPVFAPQEFRQPPHSEKYAIDRPKESSQEVSGPSNTGENSSNDDEEIQVVYVPAETLAQRGHQHKEERNRDHKHFAFPHHRQQQQRYQIVQNSELSSPDDDSYNPDHVQFPKEPTRGDNTEFLKAVRDRELERLNEQRREIQKQAKIQAAAQQREQERVRQRESEKKRKELIKIEEAAKQRELDRIREARERQDLRLQELEREKERAARAKQAEIDRLTALERQKKLELEKIERKEEERAKVLADKREKEASESVQQDYVGNQFHQQHLTETGKHKHQRNRPKARSRHHHKNIDENIERSHDTSTPAPTPNQPPLAVFMGADDLIAQEVKVIDVLRVLREAKTIAVVDQVTVDSPKVFVGPSNLDVPNTYSKFDLPYLSSLDTTRVERRVDKLPFFVAPLSFNPPVGYSKIPFPAPHIGSVIVNTIDGHLGAGPSGPSGPSGSEALENKPHPSPQPLIEPNSFLSSGQGSTHQSTYQPSYESPTTPSYSTYGQDYVTQQYQPTVHFPPSANDRFRFRQQGQQQQQQQQQQYQSTVHHLGPTEAPTASISPYQEDLNAASRPHSPDYPEEAISNPVTPGITYRKPTVVSSYGYEEEPISTTPVYQSSYVHTRVQPNSNQELSSQLAQINQHDYSQHRHVENPFSHPVQQSGGEQHHGHHHAGENFESNISGPYEDTGRGTVSPTHYSLPAELPPIHPQLPGLVNSLVENRQEKTTTTTTETPTTTEVPTSTYRTRTRQRGRVTRPLTTTTTRAPVTRESNRSNSERTRRPVSRSRSRYTTTTEEYKETYEPTKVKIPETTTRYSTSESYRRTPAPKNPKIKSRTSERPYESSTLNQIQNNQPQETVSDEANPSVESNSSQDVSYSRYNAPISSEGPGNTYTPEIDFSKTPNYPRPIPSNREQRPLADDTGIPQQRYPDMYQSGLGYQAGLIGQNDQYNYPNDNEESHLRASPAPNDYYYPDKSESVETSGQVNNPTDNPLYTQILEYTPGTYPGGQLSNEYSQSGQYSGDKNSGSVEDGQGYSHGTSYEPVEQTTEPLTTTTTEAPSTIRQRVRGRLSSRTRQDSAIQTNPRGSHDDFVQFSAVTKPPGGRTSSSRQRDSSRRVKSRPQNQAQVQSEGDGYVRIQSSNRYNQPKTIIQTAKITSTTPTPLTTTEDSSLNQEDIEYGFIRTPNFNQPQNQISSKFRAPESQIQLQNAEPTDETAEDSSPSVTQVPKHRQKYQSPNRPRPDIKSTPSSIITTTPSLEGFTNKPKVRAEEPRNRIRSRVRRPGNRKRPATTTTTTTEYVLDGNNNLPLDENYPRIPIRHVESSGERQLYDTSYETLPNREEDAMSRVDYTGENYPQDFSLNFGRNSETDEQQDDTPLPYPLRKNQSTVHRHGPSSGRLKAYSHHQTAAPERDIYGAESQWSTKLSRSSFQPGLNQLNRNEDKSVNGESGETKEEAPEIITAQPEDSFVTVLVTSDDKLNDTKKEIGSQETSIESTDYGQKMSLEGTTNSSGIIEGTIQHSQRRTGGRRRRVRIRVRPASSTEDFVTSESQHINSAVNNLVQDQSKPQSRPSTPYTTTQGTTDMPTTLPPEMPGMNESMASTDTTTINYTKVPEHTNSSDLSDPIPNTNEETVEVETEIDTTKPPTNPQTPPRDININNESTISPDIATDSPLMTTMTVPRKSWDSTNGYAEWYKTKQINYFPRSQESNEDSSESVDDKSHPKNHRSEWSEVRYPNDRELFGYGRSGALTPTTQLPGIVTKSVGDSSVKTLSDYVQAIFDTMKNADEEKEIVDNGQDLWRDEQKSTASTTTHNSSTDLSTMIELRRSETEELEEAREREVSGESNGRTEEREIGEEATSKAFSITESSNEASTEKVEEVPTTIPPPSMSETPTTLPSSPLPSESDQKLLEKTEKPSSEPVLNVPTKLGTVLRTSTMTRVSHMTEICYRGRCVMTKPRKDSHARR